MEATVVDEGEQYGLWVWRLPSGELFGDDDGNILNLPGHRYDVGAMNKMRAVAKSYGVGGKPEFRPGTRRITQMQWEYQQEVLRDGGDIDTALE